MQGEQPELVTVGWAYGMPETALALSLLESHGIRAFPQSWYMLTVDWTLSHALGGIALCVPASQRAAAAEILADCVPTRRRRPLWWLAVMVMIWAWVGFPPPPTGFVLAGPRPAQIRTATPLPDPA
mgnify:CR=1 FL=1